MCVHERKKIREECVIVCERMKSFIPGIEEGELGQGEERDCETRMFLCRSTVPPVS